MFSIIKSIFRVFWAKGESAAAAIEDNHIEVLAEQAIRDAKKGFAGIKQDYAAVLAELERNKTQLDTHQRAVRKWNIAAEKALADNDEGLAKSCLERAMTEEEGVAAMSKTVATLDARVSDLKEQVQRYKARIGDAEREKRVLIARKRVAESTQRVQETMNKVSSNANAFSVMERLKNQVEEAESRAVAEKQMTSDTEELDDKLREVSRDAAVADRLAALREKVKPEAAADAKVEDAAEKGEVASE